MLFDIDLLSSCSEKSSIFEGPEQESLLLLEITAKMGFWYELAIFWIFDHLVIKLGQLIDNGHYFYKKYLPIFISLDCLHDDQTNAEKTQTWRLRGWNFQHGDIEKIECRMWKFPKAGIFLGLLINKKSCGISIIHGSWFLALEFPTLTLTQVISDNNKWQKYKGLLGIDFYFL